MPCYACDQLRDLAKPVRAKKQTNLSLFKQPKLVKKELFLHVEETFHPDQF